VIAFMRGLDALRRRFEKILHGAFLAVDPNRVQAAHEGDQA
jgi:hypothetical protein